VHELDCITKTNTNI